MSETKQKLFTPQRDLCFIDVETTGPTMGFHEIIEIGALRTCPDAVRRISTFDRKVAPANPDRITSYAKDLTGFSTESWPKPPASRTFWESFKDFAAGATPVCHNPSFDRAFIAVAAAEFRLDDLGLDYHWIGTESLAWPLVKFCKSWPQMRFSQDTIREFLGLKPEPKRHTALQGAESCLELYKRLMEIYARSTLQWPMQT